MKSFGKQNAYSCGEYGLRRSIPFKLSSVLKASNKIDEKVALCQVSKEYETEKSNCEKKPITPLIKSDPEKSKNSVLFFKSSKSQLQDTSTLNYCKSGLLNVPRSMSNEQLIGTQNLEQFDVKMLDLVQLIQSDQIKPLDRCKSSYSLFLKTSKEPLIVRKKMETILPEPSSFYHRSKNHHGRSKSGIEIQPKIEKKNEYFLPQNVHLMSSGIYSKRSEKRTNTYAFNQKPETYQYRLCINCQNYVNKSLTLEHQSKCEGFSAILKMSNSQLIDFLDEKINKKLHKLQQIQQLYKSSGQKAKSTINLSYYQEKNRIDQILTDLDTIRLKALKRLHTKPVLK